MSTRASDVVWKARSQAAYQGYSHLSGIEITSALSMWNHSVFRTPGRLDSSNGWLLCSLSHRSRSK
jgi:hypothetical protein